MARTFALRGRRPAGERSCRIDPGEPRGDDRLEDIWGRADAYDRSRSGIARAVRLGGRPLLRHQLPHSRLRQHQQPALAPSPLEPAGHCRGRPDLDDHHRRLRSLDPRCHRPRQRALRPPLRRRLSGLGGDHIHPRSCHGDRPRHRLRLAFPAIESARRHARDRLDHLRRDLGRHPRPGGRLGARAGWSIRSR